MNERSVASPTFDSIRQSGRCVENRTPFRASLSQETQRKSPVRRGSRASEPSTTRRLAQVCVSPEAGEIAPKQTGASTCLDWCMKRKSEPDAKAVDRRPGVEPRASGFDVAGRITGSMVIPRERGELGPDTGFGPTDAGSSRIAASEVASKSEEHVFSRMDASSTLENHEHSSICTTGSQYNSP